MFIEDRQWQWSFILNEEDLLKGKNVNPKGLDIYEVQRSGIITWTNPIPQTKFVIEGAE